MDEEDALYAAALAGDDDAISKLEMEADRVDSWGETILHNESINPVIRSIMDEDALYAAALAGDADAISKLEMEADRVDVLGETILHVESGNGNTERVRFILREFAHKNLLVKTSKYKHTALHLAIYRRHTEVAELLIDAARPLPVTSFQAFLRQGDKDKDTALHAAVMRENVAIVKLLVEADPTDTHIQNDKGKTPMYIAVEKGLNDIVEIISTTCTAPSLDGPDGSTVVRIKNLDQGGTLYKIMDRDALYAAAISGDADAIAILEMQADKVYAYDRTILHIESIEGNTEHVQFIVRELASKNLLFKLGNQQENALAWAAYYGHTAVVKVLMDAARHFPPPPAANDNPVTSFQAFLRQGNEDKDTALHAAVKEGHVAIAKLLVEADPSHTHTQNNQGKTPMYIAAERGYMDIVKVICTTCTAPINLDGPGDSTTALHAAIKHPDHDIEVVNLLIGAARNLPTCSDNDHNPVTPFQAFLRQCDEELNTALHLAVLNGKMDIVKVLVEADPDDKHTQNNQGQTPIYIAAEKGYMDIVKVICTTCTAPINLDGPGGSTTALHAAIKNLDKARKEDRGDVIRLIIEAVKPAANNHLGVFKDFWLARLFKKTDEKGCIILELAVEGNYLDVVELILAQNPAYDHRSLWHSYPAVMGIMPLIYKAMDKEYNDMVNLLTETYQRVAQNAPPWNEILTKMPKLISAIREHQEESVISILQYDAKRLVTFADNLGWTSLHHAAYHKFNSIIGKIVEEQTKFEHAFVYEDMVSTPFHVAAEKGCTSTVILLMQLWPSSSSAYTAVDKNGQNILHLAALQSRKVMIQGILENCSEEYKNALVNKQDNHGNTPLHLLIQKGCLVPEIFKYRGLDIWVQNKENWTAPDMLYCENQIIDDQAQIKIALDSIQIDQKRAIFSSSVLSSKRERKDVILNKQAKRMIHEKYERMKVDTDSIANCFADAIAGDPISKAALEKKADILNEEEKTILHVESLRGDTERVRFIVREFANKNLLVKLDNQKETALHLAAHHGHIQVVKVLIDAARHIPVSSFQDFVRQATGPMGNTALHLAVLNGNAAIVKVLVEADPNHSHVPNNEGQTPIYIAAEKGYMDIVKVICTTCTTLSLDGPGGRTTALHALIQNISQVTGGASDVIGMMVNAAKHASLVDFEELFRRTDESGSTVLQLVVEKNFVEAVKLILPEDPAYQPGPQIKRNDLMRLIFKAIDIECSNEIIELLSKAYEAGIDPDHKDVLALILAIKKRDEDSVLDHLKDAKNLVSFKEDNGWTPLHYAVYHEFDSVLGAIIEAQQEVGHLFVYENRVLTPFHVAVKHGYTSTVKRLMQSWPTPSSKVTAANCPYTVVDETGRNILHLAAADNKKEMVEDILKYCPKKYKDIILKQQDNNGDTPLHLLISHGCFIRKLIKHEVLDTMPRNKYNYTPQDMLYFKIDVVADQAQIKIALDDMQTGNFFLGSKKKNISKSSVVFPSRRKIKDGKLEEGKKILMDKEHEQKKKDLETYKMRTNTQILVTALITTVTFTVGFTMPGGLHQSKEDDEGLVVLSGKRAFNVFMVSDALALLMSTSSLFFYFLESMNDDPRQVSLLNASSTVLNILSIMAMMLTFIAGTYVVLSDSPVLAIGVCIICSLFFLVIIIVWIIKIIYDRRGKKDKY